MITRSTTFGLVGLLALVAGCGSYRTVARPWNVDPAADPEFGVKREIRAGDRVRVFASASQLAEGFLIAISDSALVVAATRDDARIVTVPVTAIDRLDVYQSGGSKALTAIGVVTATTVIIYAILDAEQGGILSPADGTRAR